MITNMSYEDSEKSDDSVKESTRVKTILISLPINQSIKIDKKYHSQIIEINNSISDIAGYIKDGEDYIDKNRDINIKCCTNLISLIFKRNKVII